MFNIDKAEKLLVERGIKKQYLAELCGRSRDWLRYLKEGRSSIKPHEIAIIAEALNTTVEYLTDKTEQKEKPAEIGRLIAGIEASYLLLNEDNRKKVNERIEEYIKLLLRDQE